MATKRKKASPEQLARKLAGAERLKQARIRFAYKEEARYQLQPGHRRFWISWYDVGAFGLISPWWNTGCRMSDGAMTICAAILAPSEEAAHQRVLEAHVDRSIEPEWRFCREEAEDWTPFNERFHRADWMLWCPGEEGG